MSPLQIVAQEALHTLKASIQAKKEFGICAVLERYRLPDGFDKASYAAARIRRHMVEQLIPRVRLWSTIDQMVALVALDHGEEVRIVPWHAHGTAIRTVADYIRVTWLQQVIDTDSLPPFPTDEEIQQLLQEYQA